MTIASTIKFRTMGMYSNCHSLPKKGPWAEHLTSLPKRWVGALSTVSSKERPRDVYSDLKLLKQKLDTK